MKILKKLTLMGLLLSGLGAMAQSFTSEDVNPLNKATASEDLLEMHGTIRNNSGVDKKVLVKLITEEIMPCHETYFCWALCYSPAVKQSPPNDFIIVKKNDTSKSFKSYIVIDNCVGTGKLVYSFYDKDNPSDSVLVTFNYQIDSLETGIKTNDKNKNILSIQPNPSNGRTTINTNLGVNEIYLFDISGRMVNKNFANPSATKHFIDTESLLQGLYLVRVKSKNVFSNPQKLYVVK